jgi:hypothetical protein
MALKEFLDFKTGLSLISCRVCVQLFSSSTISDLSSVGVSFTLRGEKGEFWHRNVVFLILF